MNSSTKTGARDWAEHVAIRALVRTASTKPFPAPDRSEPLPGYASSREWFLTEVIYDTIMS
ncbi:hypothetical protein SBA6_280034 [Candidatus Sulfopaludibacter sp. SbA6]|nr:hypothetical protein SBA6_280034 [Candidatus Sulfopaludibacter sp. SbA6]